MILTQAVSILTDRESQIELMVFFSIFSKSILPTCILIFEQMLQDRGPKFCTTFINTVHSPY